MNIDKEDLKAAVDTLRKGGVILYPTDTVWGIGCDATNAEAIQRIFRIKQRNDSKAMITLVGSEVQLERTVENVPEVAWQLIDVADTPTTIIYDHGINVADNLCAEDGSLAVRLTKEEFSQQLCLRLGHPLVSTSANISGQPTPVSFNDISQDIISQVDYVCKSGRYPKDDSKPSMIIKISDNGTFKIIRK